MQGLEADRTITRETAAGLRTIAAHLQREDAEEALSPEPPEEPPHAVEAFWSLAQYFQSKGVNTEKVAHDAVANMAPAR